MLISLVHWEYARKIVTMSLLHFNITQLHNTLLSASLPEADRPHLHISQMDTFPDTVTATAQKICICKLLKEPILTRTKNILAKTNTAVTYQKDCLNLVCKAVSDLLFYKMSYQFKRNYAAPVVYRVQCNEFKTKLGLGIAILSKQIYCYYYILYICINKTDIILIYI